MRTEFSPTLIEPLGDDQNAPFQPGSRRDVSGCGEVLVETLHNILPGEIEVPGSSHHRLCIRQTANTRMLCGWDEGRYDGPILTGDLAVLPAGQPMHYRFSGVYREKTHIFLAPAFLARLLHREWDIEPPTLELIGDARFRSDEITLLGGMLCDAANDTAPGGRLLLESLSTTIAVLLLRWRSSVAGRLQAPRAGGLAPKTLARVTDYMHDHVADDISLFELSAVAKCSPQHFKRAFKASTGLPPHQFLLARRIERAQELLGNEDIVIAEVALACGFSSQSHLTTAFKRIVGTSPGRWRRSN